MKGLILTYIMAYGGAAAALFQPLIGVIVYAVFSTARPQMLFGFAGDLSGVSLIVGVATLVGWALQGFGKWDLKSAWWPVILLLGFFVWTCVSAAFASNQDVALDYVVQRLKIVALFVVAITLIDSEAWVRRFAWALVLAQGYVGFEMNLSYVAKNYNMAAAHGLLGDNNSFAISLVATIGPALFLGLAADRWWKKALAFASAALILHTVLLTFSRGGILALIITGVATVLVMPKRPSLIAAMLVAALVTARFMGPQVTARFETTFASADERDESAQSRVNLWGTCLELVQRSPIIGIGPNHFLLVAHEFGYTSGKSAHSLWFQSAAELGLPAVACLLGFYLVALKRGWREARAHPRTDRGMYGLYVFSGLTGFIIAAQFVSIEGLEVPYFIALVGAASMKLLSSEAAAEAAAAPSVSPARETVPAMRWTGDAR